VRINKLDLRHFRGFDSVTILPTGHSVLMGEPGAGRSDVVEGLTRVLWPESTRGRPPDDLDFFNRDTSQRAEVEVVLGDLGPELEQAFYLHLELWDARAHALVESLSEAEQLDKSAHEWVIRLCYRVAWIEADVRADHWVDFPKTAEPDANTFERVRYAQRQLLPFSYVRPQGRLLDLSDRGLFRQLVEGSPGSDFAPKLDALTVAMDSICLTFTTGSVQLGAAFDRVLDPVRPLLDAEGKAVQDVLSLSPDGGSAAALLRSLAPRLDLNDGCGPLPLNRHGSTLQTILEVAQAIASVDAGRSVLVIDDFGDGLDARAMQHLASLLQRTMGQVWLTTRWSAAAEVFPPAQFVRLGRDSTGRRCVYVGHAAASKAERLVARHFSLQLLPAATARAVIVVEGPHDRAALTALARRLYEEEGVLLPAARRVSIIDAGAVDNSGGTSEVARLAGAARELGLFAIAIIDGDRQAEAAETALQDCLAAADAVVRLPPGHAIELALLAYLDDAVIRAAVRELEAAFDVHFSSDLETLAGAELRKVVRQRLKKSGGLHAQFIDALEAGQYPPVARGLLETAVAAATSHRTGLIQL